MTQSRVARVRIVTSKQYQILMLSVARVKTKDILSYHTKGVLPNFIKLGSRSQKLFMFQFQYQRGKKLKSGLKISELQNGTTRGLQNTNQIQAGIIIRGRDYK